MYEILYVYSKNFNEEEKKEALIKLKGYRKKYKINIIKIFKEKIFQKVESIVLFWQESLFR